MTAQTAFEFTQSRLDNKGNTFFVRKGSIVQARKYEFPHAYEEILYYISVLWPLVRPFGSNQASQGADISFASFAHAEPSSSLICCKLLFTDMLVFYI